MKIAQLMTKDPYSIRQDEPLHQAHRVMQARRVRHLPVIDAGILVGVVSERDLYLLETLRAVDPGREPVSEAMTEQPYAVSPAAEVQGVVREMLRKKYGSAIVVEEGRVVGIFTRSDALRLLDGLLEPA